MYAILTKNLADDDAVVELMRQTAGLSIRDADSRESASSVYRPLTRLELQSAGGS